MAVTIGYSGDRQLFSGGLELVHAGFGFTEGPAWSVSGNYLVFSDIPGNQMWRWEEDGGLSSYRASSNMAHGNAFDREGRLVSCEHAMSRLTRVEADGGTTVLAVTYEGRELNSPNDVVVARDGTIYFTDPTYGRQDGFGVPRALVMGFQGVYRLKLSRELELLARDFAEPNGLCFSVDGATLYVNDTQRMHIRAFTVGDDGCFSGGDVWADVTGDEPGSPDGMKLDSEGNVYCSGPGGIHIFNGDAELLGVLAIPETVGNFAWGVTRSPDVVRMCLHVALSGQDRDPRTRAMVIDRPLASRSGRVSDVPAASARWWMNRWTP
jgi:gluconolactonase